jgi:serine/threonine protein phosphatase 1
VVWIVGDIHGCIWELEQLLRELPADDPLIFLGDYIDRGPHSKEVVDRVMLERHRAKYLLGNHEDMLLAYFKRPGSIEADAWLHPANGGRQTLSSYGLNNKAVEADFPREHLDFFESCSLYLEGDDFLAVHAGFVPELSLAEQKRDHMLWIRGEWIRKEYLWNGKHVYYGHTPTAYLHGTANMEDLILGEKSTGLDTGCVYGGYLTALEVNTNRMIQIKARQIYI